MWHCSVIRRSAQDVLIEILFWVDFLKFKRQHDSEKALALTQRVEKTADEQNKHIFYRMP